MPGRGVDKDSHLDSAITAFGQRTAYYAKLGIYIGISLGISFGIYKMFRRYKTSNDVPDNIIKSRSHIHGIVIDVSDGDTFRLYHTPYLQWTQPPPEKKRGMSKFSLSVRLSAIDAPEVSHFGKPAQPFSKEAKEFLASEILGKRVTVIPLAKDQYGRIIATVQYRKWYLYKYNASHEVLRAGLATIYRGGNAQYHGELELLESIEAEAKRAKRGMWSQKKNSYQSPAEYKRKHKK